MTINSWGSSDPVEETKGGTNQSTYTAGDILYASGANTLSKLAVGSDGEVLTLASGVPSWAAAAGGGSLTYLHSITASSDASVAFDSTYITSTYTHYLVYFYNVRPANDGVFFRSNVSTDNGSSYDNGASDYYMRYYGPNAADSMQISGFDVSDMSIGAYSGSANDQGNASEEMLFGWCHIWNIASSSEYTRTQGQVMYPGTNAGEIMIFNFGNRRNAAQTENNIRFIYTAGNIAEGEFVLYGLSES